MGRRRSWGAPPPPGAGRATPVPPRRTASWSPWRRRRTAAGAPASRAGPRSSWGPGRWAARSSGCSSSVTSTSSPRTRTTSGCARPCAPEPSAASIPPRLPGSPPTSSARAPWAGSSPTRSCPDCGWRSSWGRPTTSSPTPAWPTRWRRRASSTSPTSWPTPAASSTSPRRRGATTRWRRRRRSSGSARRRRTCSSAPTCGTSRRSMRPGNWWPNGSMAPGSASASPGRRHGRRAPTARPRPTGRRATAGPGRPEAVPGGPTASVKRAARLPS